MSRQTYRTSKTFPAAYREVVVIRDGNGKPVERWTCVGVDEGKTANFVTYDREGYRSAASL